MKRQSVFVLVVVLVMSTVTHADMVVDISPYPGIQWNALGLAVDPVNGHIFIASNSYGGEDNLYEFSPDGTLVHSTRAAFNLYKMVVGNNGHLFISASNSQGSYFLEMSQDGQTIFSSPSFSGAVGLSYDPATDTFFYVDYISPKNYRVMKMGSSVSYFDLEEPMGGSDWYAGLVYDSASENFYVHELNTSAL